jgi:hypothetical protein
MGTVALTATKGNGLRFGYDGLSCVSGMQCKEGRRSGLSVVIYTPLKWIEYQAAVAHTQLRPFTYADVSPTMREPILRVMA